MPPFLHRCHRASRKTHADPENSIFRHSPRRRLVERTMTTWAITTWAITTWAAQRHRWKALVVDMCSACATHRWKKALVETILTDTASSTPAHRTSRKNSCQKIKNKKPILSLLDSQVMLQQMGVIAQIWNQDAKRRVEGPLSPNRHRRSPDRQRRPPH